MLPFIMIPPDSLKPSLAHHHGLLPMLYPSVRPCTLYTNRKKRSLAPIACILRRKLPYRTRNYKVLGHEVSTIHITATSPVNMKLYRILSLKHGRNTLNLLRQPLNFVIPFSQVGSNAKISLTGPGLLPASFLSIKKDCSFNLINPTA